MGGRGSSSFSMPSGMTKEIYDRYKSDGWDDSDIARIWSDKQQMQKLRSTVYGKEQRDVTSTTYDRAQKRLKNDVSNWMGKR